MRVRYWWNISVKFVVFWQRALALKRKIDTKRGHELCVFVGRWVSGWESLAPQLWTKTVEWQCADAPAVASSAPTEVALPEPEPTEPWRARLRAGQHGSETPAAWLFCTTHHKVFYEPRGFCHGYYLVWHRRMLTERGGMRRSVSVCQPTR